MKLLLVAACALTAACASAAPRAPAAVAPAQAQAAGVGLSAYEGTYVLQWPDRVLDLRVWLDERGRLNGELVEVGSARRSGRAANAGSCTPRGTTSGSCSRWKTAARRA